MQGVWERQTGPYQNGENYRLGKVIVGSAFYASGSRDESAKFKCECLLPGIKQSDIRYTTIDEAKARLERMVAAWFSWVKD